MHVPAARPVQPLVRPRVARRHSPDFERREINDRAHRQEKIRTDEAVELESVIHPANLDGEVVDFTLSD